jgi:hypothetical protein
MVSALLCCGVIRKGAHFACKTMARKRQIREFLASAERRYRRVIFAQETTLKKERASD